MRSHAAFVVAKRYSFGLFALSCTVCTLTYHNKKPRSDNKISNEFFCRKQSAAYSKAKFIFFVVTPLLM